MAVLSLKNRHEATDSSDLAKEAMANFPWRLQSLYEAEVVLFDTACNRYTLLTRNQETHKKEWISVRGSNRGRKFCIRLGHLVGN